MENIGPKGGFFVSGYTNVYKQINGKWYLQTSATGFCPVAATMGIDISFSGSTDLIVDGNVIQSQSFYIPPNENYIIPTNSIYIGQTVMQLPTTGRVELRINASYIMTEPGGSAVPLPGLSRIIPIH